MLEHGLDGLKDYTDFNFLESIQKISEISVIRLICDSDSYFACDDIINEGFTQFFEFFDLGVDGLDDLVYLCGFGVEIVRDRLLFFGWRKGN